MLEHPVHIFKPHENSQKHKDPLQKQAEVWILLQRTTIYKHNQEGECNQALKAKKQ